MIAIIKYILGINLHNNTFIDNYLLKITNFQQFLCRFKFPEGNRNCLPMFLVWIQNIAVSTVLFH